MTFTIGVPQLIWIGLALFAIVGTATLHGRPRTGKHNAVMMLVSVLLQGLLMWWGGFFG